jgi:hypothetical protein
MTDRIVGAPRARILRRRGEDIRFDHFTCRGKARYRWVDAHPRDPHAPRWSSARVALLAYHEECDRQRRILFQPFLDTVRQQIVDAFGLPPSMVDAGPRLGEASAARGWIG